MGRPRRGIALRTTLAAAALAAVAAITPGASVAKPNKPGKPNQPAQRAAQLDRYSLANGCFAVRSEALGRFVVKAGGAYDASAGGAGGAEPFTMQATTLGRYLFYGAGRDFMAAQGDATQAAAEPSDASDWTVEESGDAFTITNGFLGVQLAVGGDGGLVTVPAGSAGSSGLFDFHETSGCAAYPEVEVNATGGPSTGSPVYGEVAGFLEGHMHGMAFEFLGGRAHCGRPWHRFGAPYALRDCIDHEASDGCGAVLENVLFGNPARCHDPVGWPTFKDWPHPESLTHEQSYYRWIERAWRGGMRVYVNLMVENRVLCELYPLKQNDCDEMVSVDKQIQDIYEMQDYIDAQNGGPGKGWFRIVDDPFEAREVINQGKLAVVLGMEVSEPFGCRVFNGQPLCDAAQIDASLDHLYEQGVRQLEIVNKFDNALTGVAGDGGTTGTITNSGNFSSTGRFWDLHACHDPENHDHSPTAVEHNDDLIIANGLDGLLPGGLLPVYGQGPHCNALGLSGLGEHALQGIMDRGMIFDPDHMSVVARNQALDFVEAQDYPGIVSSHSWSTPNAYPRIWALGGVIMPYAGSSEGFVEKWQQVRDQYSGRQYYGIGYGADMNGFGSQGLPRGADVPNPVTYPFQSFDGQVTLDRQRSGERLYDINTDGVAHYGLYPDWIEDLRMLAGDAIVNDMGRGAEAYLQMWERTEGIHGVSCAGWGDRRIGRRGFGARLRLNQSPRQVLESAGQPVKRTRVWRWCTSAGGGQKAGGDRNDVAAVFTKRDRVGLILSSVPKQKAGGARSAPASPSSSAAAPRG
jgi:microsomal dipeptidase-like Zn-dependent dipeptidase